MSTTTEAPPVPARRVSRLWRAAQVLVGLLVLAAFLLWAFGAVTARRGQGSLAEAIAETDALDPDWRWDAIDGARPPLPPFGNSALVAVEVNRARVYWQQNELNTADGKDVLQDRVVNHRLDAERLQLIRKYLDRRQDTLALALTLKDLPRGRAPVKLTPDVISTLLPHVQTSREVAALLQLDCEALLHAGRAAEVPARVRAILHSGAGLRDEPFLISQLVRCAVRSIAARQVERALAMGQLGDEDCRKLGDHFAAERAENLLLAGLRGERAGIHVLFDNLEAGRVSLADFYRAFEGGRGAVPQVFLQVGATLYGPRLYEDHASFLRWSNRACTIAAMPVHEQKPEWDRYSSELRRFVADNRQTLRNILTTLLMPAYDKTAEAAIRDQALLGCLQAALAAERFRLAQGRWPTALEELCPKYLAEVPTDAFSGKPLGLKATEDGVVIYSVSKDGVDDGGKLDLSTRKAAADFGVQLWDVERRGLELLKPPADK